MLGIHRHQENAMRNALAVLAVAALLCACNAPDDGAPDRAADATVGSPGPDAASDQPPAPPPARYPEDEDDGHDIGDIDVPERYRGDWAADAAACERRGDVSRLHIDDDDIRFHESSGPILVFTEDGSSLTLTARLTGEGETREATYAFTLSADGISLADANCFARVRCDQ